MLLSLPADGKDGEDMRALGLIPALAVMLVLIPAVPGLGPAQAVEILAPQDCGGIGMVRLLEYGVGDDDPGDLNACQQKCRGRLGVVMYSDTDSEPQWFRGRGSSRNDYAYAQCMEECNRAFWKDFDKKHGEDSEKER